jgi:hypothetical protein
LLGVVDVDAIGRGVDDVVAARAIVDARVAAGQVALTVERPIVPPLRPNSIEPRSPRV